MNHQVHQVTCVFAGVIAIGMAGYVCSSFEEVDNPKRDQIARQTISSETMPADEHIQLLTGYLTNETLSNGTRRLASLALSRLGEPAAVESVPILVQQLSDHDAGVIAWSAKALGKFGPFAAGAAPTLVGVLEHSDAAPRNASIEALGQIGTSHPTVVPALAERVVRWRTSDSPELLESEEYVLNAIGQIGSDAASCIPAILRTAESKHERLRLASVAALGQMGATADIAIPALVERLVFDDSAEVRQQAITAISNVGPAAVPALGRVAKAGDDQARIAAITALGLIGRSARAQLPALISATEDPSGPVALAAAKAVHAVSAGGIDVSPILLRSLAHKDRQVRMEAARMFSAIESNGRTSAVRKALEQLTAEPDPYAKQAAGKVLRDLFEQ